MTVPRRLAIMLFITLLWALAVGSPAVARVAVIETTALPVSNVAMPLLEDTFPGRPPFRLLELPVVTRWPYVTGSLPRTFYALQSGAPQRRQDCDGGRSHRSTCGRPAASSRALTRS